MRRLAILRPVLAAAFICTALAASADFFDFPAVQPVAKGGTGQTSAAAARGASGLNVESATGHGDSAYTILATDRWVYTNAAFTASRTWTLPAASAVNPGAPLVIDDLQLTVTAANTLIISRASSDTINGGTSSSIDVAGGRLVFFSDGVSKWSARLQRPYGTAAGNAIYLDSAGKLPAVDGSALTNLNAGNISSGTIGGARLPREILSADRTYYVAASGGSDSNNCTALGTPCATWQHAIDLVHDGLDLAGHNVTIQAIGTSGSSGGSGSWSGAITVNGPFTGAQQPTAVQLIGDTTTPTNFSLTNQVSVQYGARIAIKGFSFAATGLAASSPQILAIYPGSQILLNGNFAISCTTRHLQADQQGNINITSNYTVSAGADYHWRASQQGQINARNITVTVSGTPNFTSAFAGAVTNSLIAVTGNTYSGSATGKLYDVQSNAVVNSGVTLPGGTAGTTATGGQYL